MQFNKQVAIVATLLLVLSACSTVKLDESATVEDRAGKPVPQITTQPYPGDPGRVADGTASATSSSNGSSSNGSSSNGSSSNGSSSNGSNGSNGSNSNSSKSKDPLNDPASVLAKRSIYFDLDSFVVKDEFKPVLEAHAKYLNSRKDRKIIIQGNTDERGGSEYNLALGQKRSEAVRRSLQLMGVADNQMEAISLGKEKPKATGSGEEAWAENRRVDIVY